MPAENAQKLNDAVSSKNNTIKILTTDDGGAEHAHVDNRQVGIDFTAGCSATICKARNEALAEVPSHKPGSTTSSPSQQRFSTVPRLNLRYMAKPPQGFEVSKGWPGGGADEPAFDRQNHWEILAVHLT